MYAALKLIHLAALILWIGPPLGAYYFVYSAHRSKDQVRIVWAERCAERVLLAEHIAFAILLLSGTTMLILSDGVLLAMPWMQKKLWLFAGVLFFELFDIFFAHVLLKRILELDDPLASEEWPRLARLRRTLAVFGALVGAILIPAIMYFAVVKS